MTDKRHDVKSFRDRACAWIDHHPRTGWYVAAWAFLISLNALIGYIDLLLQAIT